MRRTILPALILMAGTVLAAQGTPLEVQAKFVKVLLTASGQFGFACNDPALKSKLEALGISVGPGFKFAWAMSDAEVVALKVQDRFIVCPNVDWFKHGACLAVVQEEGRPQLYLSVANVKASGVTVPEAIVKIAKKM